jgi:hypothetical protein
MTMLNETNSQMLIDFDETALNFKRRISARLRLGDKDLLGNEYERSADQSWEGEWDKSWFEKDDGTYADFG